ncbi:hypothetical protein ISCGN_024074 [Ixodes scapularis]
MRRRRRRREKHHESSSISPRTADVKQRPVICAVWASHRRAIYGAFETRVNPPPDRRKKKKGKTSSPLLALHVGADHRGDFGVLDILHRYIDMSAYRRFFVSTVLYLYLFAELDALRTCPDRCICVGTTVRCMFLKLQTLPRVPEDTTVLDLRYNNIREVPARSFEDLEQLETLLLNNNQIRHIEGHGFEGLRNLRHLYIFKNRIKYLDENSFAGLQSLEQLYLHDNLLQEIGEPPFLGLLSLERLFLNDNRIRTVHKGALQNLRQLRRLRLDNNPLTCDCSLMWFTQMLQEKQTITQATGHCSLPASLAGKPLTSLVENLECGPPAPIPNGSLMLTNGTRHYLSSVEYGCREGYVLVGRSILVCDVDQRWNGPPPRCEPVMCRAPTPIAHGLVRLSAASTVFGTVAEYDCEPGFLLSGPGHISCGPSGFWQGDIPVCLRPTTTRPPTTMAPTTTTTATTTSFEPPTPEPTSSKRPPLIPTKFHPDFAPDRTDQRPTFLTTTLAPPRAVPTATTTVLPTMRPRPQPPPQPHQPRRPAFRPVDNDVAGSAGHRTIMSPPDLRGFSDSSPAGAKLNMGGFIALGVFGGFVVLAAVITIVVIVIRRSR